MNLSSCNSEHCEGQWLRRPGCAGLERIGISFGMLNPDPGTAIRTRSLMQILSTLGAGVEIPQDHPTHESAIPLEKPNDAFVAVPNQGLRFWIDRRNLPSKTTLATVTLLFNFLDGGSKASLLLTIPTN